MKLVIVLGLFIVATVYVFYLGIMNRASERIMTSVIPIAVAALVGVTLAVLVFGGEAPMSATFPASFILTRKTKMPANLPWILWSRRFTQAEFAPAALYKDHPELFKTDEESGYNVYHHLLQWAIVKWMGMVPAWQMEATWWELPGSRQLTSQPVRDAIPPLILTEPEIRQAMAGNMFAEVNSGIPPRIALPPGTKMTVVAPRDMKGMPESEIRLSNKFCTITIRTQFSSMLAGAGAYSQLAGLSEDENNEIQTVTYVVRLNATFSRTRSGHPDMPKYKAWVNGLFGGMQEQFDEQRLWAKTKDDYLFYKQVQAFGPISERALMRSTSTSTQQSQENKAK